MFERTRTVIGWLGRALLLAALSASCSAGPPPAPARPKKVAVESPPQPAPSGDPNSPEYFLERIELEEWRDRSVLRLSQMLETARAEAEARVGEQQAAKDPALVALVERSVGPLTKAYAEHRAKLSPGTREAAMRAFQAIEDPRSEPALRKAATLLAEYAEALPAALDQASDPERDLLQQELEPALAAYAALGSRSLERPLLRAYVALHARNDGVFCALARAMSAAPQPLWADEMLTVLRRLTTLEDEPYNRCWRETAIRVLTELRDQRAVTPLLRLSMRKRQSRWVWDQGHALAETALISLGSEEFGIMLVVGSPEAARSLELEPGDDAAVAGAWLLGLIANPESRSPLEQLLARRHSPKVQAAILRALIELPGSASSHAAIRAGLKDLSRRTKPTKFLERDDFPPRVFDPALVEVILRWARQLKDDGRERALASAMLLMEPEHVAAVDRAMAGETDDELRQVLLVARELVLRCQKRADCYAEAFRNAAEKGSDSDAITRAKALYMLAVYGNAESIEKLLLAAESPRIENELLAPLVDEVAIVRTPGLEALLERRAKDSKQIARTLARLRRRPSAH